MKVGDLVRLKWRASAMTNYPTFGIITARFNSPEWGAGWEYSVMWDVRDWSKEGLLWNARDLELISEGG